MRMHEVEFPRGAPIDAYGADGFEIGGAAHAGGVLILPGRVLPWRPAATLGPDCFAEIVAAGHECDLLILGTGATLAPPPADARAAIEAALGAVGAALEIMATPAACRTFNVLLAENRAVAAALTPI